MTGMHQHQQSQRCSYCFCQFAFLSYTTKNCTDAQLHLAIGIALRADFVAFPNCLASPFMTPALRDTHLGRQQLYFCNTTPCRMSLSLAMRRSFSLFFVIQSVEKSDRTAANVQFFLFLFIQSCVFVVEEPIVSMQCHSFKWKPI